MRPLTGFVRREALMSVVAVLYVAAGGALGAVARYGLGVWVPRQADVLPYATLASNLLGCLVMGAVLQWLADVDGVSASRIADEHYRLLFAVGFCGSFTTLSALVFELSSLLQRGDMLLAFGYLLATIAGGFACFWLGIALVRALSTTA